MPPFLLNLHQMRHLQLSTQAASDGARRLVSSLRGNKVSGFTYYLAMEVAKLVKPANQSTFAFWGSALI